MGCYDSIIINCPTCGEPYEAQSKSGNCNLNSYTLLTAPFDVLKDVNRHAPFTCTNCGTNFKVEFAPYVTGVRNGF